MLFFFSINLARNSRKHIDWLLFTNLTRSIDSVGWFLFLVLVFQHSIVSCKNCLKPEYLSPFGWNYDTIIITSTTFICSIRRKSRRCFISLLSLFGRLLYRMHLFRYLPDRISHTVLCALSSFFATPAATPVAVCIWKTWQNFANYKQICCDYFAVRVLQNDRINQCSFTWFH